MAGIYIHIPFCNKKCYYCDFYSIAALSKKPVFINALLHEIELRKNYLSQKKIQTIYFGGGTPSVLSSYELQKVLHQITKYYKITDNVEITLEVNPDDLNKYYLKEIKSIGINRLSIGIQSFNNEVLKFLNRRHNAGQAINSVNLAKSSGFNNISIDLIYGIPNMDIYEWEKTLEKAIKLNIEHISAYHLTIEKNTVFGKMKKQGKLKEVNEELSWEQFNMLIDVLKNAGFEHYEISNFAKNKYYSKHNTSYWQQKEYLGLGPSAHSYNLNSRQWNISDVNKYVSFINLNKIAFIKEILTNKEKYNEYMITGLRTMWGIDINYIQQQFGEEYSNYLYKIVDKMPSDLFIKKFPEVTLSRKGLFQCDAIISKLIVDKAK